MWNPFKKIMKKELSIGTMIDNQVKLMPEAFARVFAIFWF